MTTRDHCFRSAAILLAASVAVAVRAQPPTSTDIDLPEERRIPAEETAASYRDSSWAGPQTSWGHPSLEGTWSTDDMRGIGRDRQPQYGTAQSLPPEEFLRRAAQQHSGRNRAVNEETFLRNEWGTRTFGYTSLVIDPPDGRTPPLNELGRARAESVRGQGTFGPGPFDAFDDFSLYDRCITLGINRGMGAAIYGNGIRIAQSPDTVTIVYEMIHDTRVIPLDGRPHLDEAITQYPGNSRGYWDGDTLVIEGQGYTDKTSVGGGPHSTRLRTVERLRRVDPEMIEYQITVDDPETYTAPFTVRTMWTTQPDYYMYEYSCHEGNGAVGHALSGERAYEQQVAEAIAAGLPVPPRSNGMSIYGQPAPDAQIFDINAGQ